MYEFLRGNKELESIFEEHLKQVVKCMEIDVVEKEEKF